MIVTYIILNGDFSVDISYFSVIVLHNILEGIFPKSLLISQVKAYLIIEY